MLHALPTAATSGAGQSNLIFLAFVLLAFGALWLMSSRTRKQQKAAQELRNNLVAGDEVMTASGLFGTVVDIAGDVVTLETSPGVTTRWVRAAILKKVDPPTEPPAVAPDERLDEVDEFAVPDDLSSLDEGPDKRRSDDPEK
ncbi:preprotein translocase subunit YajC [Cellulomonas citrea]|uniref:preprotein translocase subunit YajC n=1 Tax=Cellulomonas citrea TaxID=1909423 RepID=UPI0013577C3A|nr:preprotein translocase subunit YajC [Cellulomonas citrea]